MRFRSLVTLALATGLLAGFAELIGHGVRRYVLHEFLFLGPDVLWTAPLVNAAIFLLLGFGLFVGARLLPRLLTLGRAAGFFVFIGSFGAFYIFPQFHRVAALIFAAGLGLQAARWADRRGPEHLSRLSGRLLPSLLGAVLLIAILVRGGRALAERRALGALPAPTIGAPNVLLIVLDTVRSFNLSLYGYHRNTSPSLDAFAAGGTTFDRAFSTAPWTLPSHASMFTGLWPQQLSASWLVPLTTEVPTLAEAMARHGYVPVGFSGNTNYVSHEVGLARGFVSFEDYVLTPALMLRNSSLVRVVSRNRTLRRLIGEDDALGRKNAADIDHSFFRWLDHRPAGRPFFAFINFYDAHRPYLPPPPYDRMFVPPGTEPDPRLRRTALAGDDTRIETTAWAENAYDGGLAWLDSRLGVLFAELERRGLTDSTLIIVTADHGEEFGEHGLFDHGNSLYRQAVQVPLVIRHHGGVPAGLRVQAPVSLRDIPMTVLDLAGVGGERFPGAPLARYFGGGSPGPDTLLQGVRKAIRQPDRYPAAQGNLAALIQDSVRYIRNLGTGEERLYDLEHDPLEQHDLAGTADGQARLPTLRAELDRVRFAP
ncbi:MAG: sulfatase [Gemmatimonadales bacterium]